MQFFDYQKTAPCNNMAVVFCGFFLGGYWGMIAGGVGSAIADLIGGFFVFAPITFIAKRLEALIAATLGKKNKKLIQSIITLSNTKYYNFV